MVNRGREIDKAAGGFVVQVEEFAALVNDFRNQTGLRTGFRLVRFCVCSWIGPANLKLPLRKLRFINHTNDSF